MEFICDYENLKDLGEAITILRVKKLELNEEAFAKMMGISVPVLRDIEEGRSMYAYTIIKKLIDKKQMKADICFKI